MVSGPELCRGQISPDGGFEVLRQCAFRQPVICGEGVLVHGSCYVSKYNLNMLIIKPTLAKVKDAN